MGTINQTTEKTNYSVLRGEHDTSSWDDIIIPPSGLSRNNLAPDRVTFIGSVEAPAFSGSTLEQLSGSFEIPHDYKEGSTLRPHIHWAPSTTGIGNVEWQLEYTVACVGDVFPSSVTVVAVDAANGIDREHNAVEFGTIDGTGLEIGCMIQFRLFRDGGVGLDTYGSDAFLLSIGVHYEQDSDGSRNTFTKGV